MSGNFERFSTLSTLCIDASSLIYMIRAGFLGYLAHEVELLATPAVVAEARWPRLPVRTMLPSARAPDPRHENDEQLLALARELKVPLVSEDKRLLARARETGLPYFNSLIMLSFLVARDRLTPAEYPEYRDRLLEFAHYSDRVIRTADQMHAELCRRRVQSRRSSRS